MVEQRPSTARILSAFRAVPLGVRRAVFRGGFRLFYHASARRRLITLHNLRRAFPEKPLEEIVCIAKASYDHAATCMADFFEIPNIDAANVHAWMDMEGLDHCLEAWERRKGIIASIAHFGNWEFLTVAFPLLEALARRQEPNRPLPAFPKTAHVVYRPLDNPLLENLVTWTRACHGVSMIPKGGTIRMAVAALKKGEIVAIVGDQNVSPREGVFTEFFHRPACTATGIAILAMRTGASVLPVYLYRREDGGYRFGVRAALPMADTGNREADLQTNAQRYTTAIEEIVREHPEQYFWMHQRWKTRPGQPA